jgi:hypothetical protein
MRVQDDGAGILPLGERGEVALTDHLQPAEAADDPGEGQGQDAGEHEDAGAQAPLDDSRALAARARHRMGVPAVLSGIAASRLRWAAARPVPAGTYSRARRTC